MKLLIADDEFTTIKRIERQIDWDSLPIDEIRTADDGISALEVCKDFTPDILLSDIRMPRMDGIALATALRENNPDLKLIFISGYAEVDYYKSAIRLNVVNFIEKPINMPECYQALKKACDEILAVTNIQNELQELSDNALQKIYGDIAILFSSVSPDIQEAVRLMDSCGSKKFDTDYCAAIKIDFHRPEQRLMDALIGYHNIVNATASSLDVQCCSAIKHDYIVCFLFYNSNGNSHVLNEFCNSSYVALTEVRAHFTISVGRVSTSLKHLHDSYEEAVVASIAAFYHESGYISWYYNTSRQYPLDQIDPETFTKALLTQPREQVVFRFRTLSSDIRECEATLPHNVKKLYFSLAHEIYLLAEKQGYRIWPEFDSVFSISDHIMSREYMKDIEAFLLAGIEAFYHQREESTTGNSTVDHIIRYIRENYSDPDLSVSTISTYVGLSDTYASKLFKTVTGESLKTYISDYRMDQAAEMLLLPGYQVADVAIKTGFRNGNYFASKFKEKFACTPSEYKEHHGN